MSTHASDKAAILKLHKDWWEANGGLRVPLMQTAFPVGADSYLMFNLNGHPYFGIEEKTKLWEYYSTRLEVDMPQTRIMRLDIDGNMAYLCAEGIFPARFSDHDANSVRRLEESADSEHHALYVRATEVYKRDDGAGEPVWKMWHFHCSPLPPMDEPRPAFDDTYASRGLGYVPGHDFISVVG